MKRAVALAVSLLILALVWWRVDLRSILAAAAAADPLWLALGLAAVVPLTLGTAWRFKMLSRSPLGVGTAARLILSSSTLNLILPSKAGDFAKAWVLTRRYGVDGKLALSVVVLEKMLDLASLLFWGVLALLWIGPDTPLLAAAAAATAGLLLLLTLLLVPGLSGGVLDALSHLLPGRAGALAAAFGRDWRETLAWFWSETGRAGGTLLLSLGLWAAHLAQFWLFARALGFVPFLDNMAFATLSILAGLLPFTMAGIGTRDAAIVWFYRDWLSPGQGAVLGVLATLRYVLPAIAGLLFVRDFWDRRAAAAPR